MKGLIKYTAFLPLFIVATSSYAAGETSTDLKGAKPISSFTVPLFPATNSIKLSKSLPKGNMTSSGALRVGPGGGNATPTKYVITMGNIEFRNAATGQYVPFITSTAAWDIASVNPGATVGTMAETSTLPPGTYDKIRMVVNKTMSVRAVIEDIGGLGRCRTESNPVTANIQGVGTVYQGMLDNNDPEDEPITVPSSEDNNDPNFVDQGATFLGTLPVNFTVTSNVPTITVAFNVANATEFVAHNGSCYVFPAPPSLTITST
jgi:hypothetical protein